MNSPSLGAIQTGAFMTHFYFVQLKFIMIFIVSGRIKIKQHWTKLDVKQ